MLPQQLDEGGRHAALDVVLTQIGAGRAPEGAVDAADWVAQMIAHLAWS